jgi:uncharacterized protein YecE (DUF72 family)
LSYRTHEQWFGSLFTANTAKERSLEAYAKYFNSIEGSTSFYHIPDEKTLQRWTDQVPNDFRFTFKFHRIISHDKKRLNIEEDLHLILRRLIFRPRVNTIKLVKLIRRNIMAK